MGKIAFIIGETFIYWNSIILTLGVLTTALLFLAFYLGRSGNGIGGFAMLPLSILFSMFLGRLIHWYCQADSYASMEAAITNYSSGSYALCGAFFGCFLAACLLRAVFLVKDLPQLLDAMSLAGAAGIAVGRLASFFTSADRGQILADTWALPIAWPVANPVTGAPENRLAVFMLQAMVCGAIFALLFVFWLTTRKRERNGDTFLLFLLLYGAAQAVLDSTRYDSLFLRSNGFVSLVQILGALAVVFSVVFFSVRMVRSQRLRLWHPFAWLLIAGGLGGAGYMEYYVQRHGNLALFCYTVMSGCMILVILVTLAIYFLGGSRDAKKKIILQP